MPGQNSNRWWEILRILSKYGFPTLLLSRKYSQHKGGSATKSFVGQKLRQAMEELGPTFIKLGQFLSTRPDLIGTEIASQLTGLQEQVEPMTMTQVREQITRSLGQPPEVLFPYFDYSPAASASIGQVHLAVLTTGERVAVKVQRPNIEAIIHKDLQIIERLLPLIRKPLALDQMFDVEDVLSSFRRTLDKELDFRQEGQNIENFREALSDIPAIIIPRLFWRYTTREILTMEWLEGNSVTEFAASVSRQVRTNLAESLMLGLLLPCFRTGLFHGDLHPGNVRFFPDGRLALLDFGITGYISNEFRQQSGELLTALWRGNVDKVVDLALTMGRPTGRINEHHFYEDMAVLVNRIKGLGLEANTFGDILLGMVHMSLSHGLKMPPPFFLLGKALALAESLAKELDPGFNILSLADVVSRMILQEKVELATREDNITGRLMDWQQLFMG
ncbi:MAG TPA: AarF/UbiB family protein, partial [Bacillota bacterium]|nr:AarF/UbiB family protein [Bacillota bacterium]